MVLHTLVSIAGKGLTIAQLATACERNPADPADMDEIEAAIEVLLIDGLAQSREDLYQPTRAAIRAAELSF